MDWNVTFEMAALSLASYDDDSEAIKEWYDHTIFLKHPRTGTEVYAVAGHGTRIIVIRGSDALTDWLWNLFLVFRKNGIHRGFYESAEDLLQDQRLLNFLYEHRKEGSIMLCGHSRGGSIAQILATELEDVAAVWGFGVPRVGGRKWKALYRKLRIPTFLFKNKRDYIPNLPPRWWGYTNTTSIQKLDGKDHDMNEYLDAADRKAHAG